jgi:hypothetical protein
MISLMCEVYTSHQVSHLDFVDIAGWSQRPRGVYFWEKPLGQEISVFVLTSSMLKKQDLSTPSLYVATYV